MEVHMKKEVKELADDVPSKVDRWADAWEARRRLYPETMETKASPHKGREFAFDFGDILTYKKPDGEDVMALFIEHPNKDRRVMEIYMINEDVVATVRSRCVRHTGYGTRFLPRKK